MASCVFDAILALSVFVANLFGIPVTGFFVLYFLELPGSPGKGHGSERSMTRRHRRNFPGARPRREADGQESRPLARRCLPLADTGHLNQKNDITLFAESIKPATARGRERQ